MGLLFDKYLIQSAQDFDETPEVKRSRRLAMEVAAIKRKYKDVPEIMAKVEGLAERFTESVESIAKLTAEIYKLIRDVEADFGLECKGTTVLLADNVVQYYFDQGEKLWGDDDFFSCVPPFELTWVESQRPNVQSYPAEYPSRFAFWVQSGKIPMESEWKEGEGAFDLCSKLKFDCPQKPNFLVRVMLYVKADPNKPSRFEQNQVKGPCKMWMMALDASGKIINKDSAEIDVNAMEGVDCERLFQCLLLTFSLLHCKNVQVSDIDPPAKHSSNWMKKHGNFLTSYKILNIEPMRKAFREQTGAETGAIRSMHICRGHFSDYRERGLFGKYKGIFWWDSHVRGSAERGIVAKSYRIGKVS